MRVNDRVELTLHDKKFTGSVVRVYKKSGWEGYVDVLLDDTQKIIIPISFLTVIDELAMAGW